MRKSQAWLLAACLAGVMGAQAAVKGEEVSYSAGGVTMKGWLASDDVHAGKRPAVLVVHEWWGHNEHARNSARKLAEAGYVALAVDMYGDGKTASHPSDAGKFAGEVSKNKAAALERYKAARALLEKHPAVQAGQVAAIGYCFGGGQVLSWARQGEDLKAVASFHGSLGSDAPAQSGKVKAQVLVLTGADDPMAPATDVEAFKKEMQMAGVKHEVVSYPGVKHSFTNPQADENAKKFDLPLAYDAKADADSWSRMLAFLKTAFSK
jgi:dienelactone hydrolase